MRSWHFDSQAVTDNGVTTYDRAYGSMEEREERKMLVGNGVYANPATNMQVVSDSGLAVKVKPGRCWIEGAFGVVDSDESKILASSASGRIDLIVARFDLSLAARDIHIDVIQGTEGSASPPSLVRNNSTYDIQLARVNIRAGATSILQSDIVDTRYDKSVCGIVAGVINQIDTTALFSQYQSCFDEFMSALETTLSEDTAGNLMVLINNHEGSVNNPHKVSKSQIGLGNLDNVKQYSEINPPPGPYITRVTLNQGKLLTVTFDFTPSAVLLSCTPTLVDTINSVSNTGILTKGERIGGVCLAKYDNDAGVLVASNKSDDAIIINNSTLLEQTVKVVAFR